MSRNRYAVILLVVLALALWLAGRYVDRTTAALSAELRAACTLALEGRSGDALLAYHNAAEHAADASSGLALLVRRNLIDEMNQTLSVLPNCVATEGLTDLKMETARACCQLQQIRQSFFGCF